MRLGVFGGTFDPIHLGHLIVAAEARSTLGLDRLLFVPNREPPHKTGRTVTPVEDRVAMVRLAIASNPGFALDLTEVRRPGPSYMIDTLHSLSARHPDAEVILVLGSDAAAQLDSWRQPEAILDEFRLAIITRPIIPGYDRGRDGQELDGAGFPGLPQETLSVDVPYIGVSGEDIRSRVAEGRPIRYHVPLDVEQYIRERGLYLGALASGALNV